MILGLTGHSGSGKTTVAAILSQLGFYHIDCDGIVHTRVYTDPEVHRALSRVFGPHIVKDGEIDRRALATIVFSDDTQYGRLMDTVKPFIDKAVLREIDEHRGGNVLVDAPGLFEYGMHKICDKTLGVISDCALSRIIERDGISEDEARSRLAHQQSHGFYRENCDYIIENNGTYDTLTQNVRALFYDITEGGLT